MPYEDTVQGLKYPVGDLLKYRCIHKIILAYAVVSHRLIVVALRFNQGIKSVPNKDFHINDRHTGKGYNLILVKVQPCGLNVDGIKFSSFQVQ